MPADVAAAVDAKCLELEQSTTKPPLEALDGAWRVVYSNAPSPSNGALGPLRGDGLQIVDVAKRRYANELRLFGGNARVTLEATFTGDAEELASRSAASDSCCLAIKSLKSSSRRASSARGA